MTDTADDREGTIEFRGYRTWYRRVGRASSPRRAPLVVLHGGPGATHAYLEPLSALAATGREIVFYDQLGCGNSDRPQISELYTPQLFIDELDALRAQLGLDRVHLLGQSWGGMLAMEYALRAPRGVLSMIVADSPADLGAWVREANRLREALPPDVAETLSRHEAAGTTTDPAYEAAVEVFYRRHVCRLPEWPEPFVRTVEALTNDGYVYRLMNGPSEFHVVGTLRGWSILDRLHEIRIPTLLLSGLYDEATPAIVGAIHQRIERSEWIVFPQSSHTPHLEEPVAFNAAVTAYLAGIEAHEALL